MMNPTKDLGQRSSRSSAQIVLTFVLVSVNLLCIGEWQFLAYELNKGDALGVYDAGYALAAVAFFPAFVLAFVADLGSCVWLLYAVTARVFVPFNRYGLLALLAWLVALALYGYQMLAALPPSHDGGSAMHKSANGGQIRASQRPDLFT